MGSVAGVLREQRELLAGLDARRDRVVASILGLARGLDVSDREAAEELLEAAGQFGRREQADHGQLILVLAQADRVRAARGGVKAWVATHLDACDGRARGIAESARRIGSIPELAEPLCSGRIGADTVRALTRTAKAVAGTGRDTAAALAATLATVEREGVTAAKKQVQVLEHTLDPGRGEDLIARQRRRSFFRVVELGDGLCRFEAVLDAVRATTLRSAIDVQSADWIRRAQYDHQRPLPDDVRSTEQINAHALVRLAEVFHLAPPEVREARFSPTVLYFTAQHAAETVYGDLIPLSAIENPDTHLLEADEDGAPVALDGEKIDTAPAARLASRAQRTALAHRDRHCTYPGCARPTTWSLHAHHVIPFSNGGPTVVRNLTLLCSEHHTLAHRE
jgi:HNH endonuclease